MESLFGTLFGLFGALLIAAGLLLLILLPFFVWRINVWTATTAERTGATNVLLGQILRELRPESPGDDEYENEG